MKKYVPKEHVEKGLVDPKKPLQEQPQYKEVLDKEYKPKVQYKQANQATEKPPQKKREKPQRAERPVFNWNKKDITLETKVAEKPKKILAKPDRQKFEEILQKLKNEKQALNDERIHLIDEQRAVIKDNTESKKTGRLAINQYSGAMKEKIQIEVQLGKDIKILNKRKDELRTEIEMYKKKVYALEKPKESQFESTEEIKRKIDKLDHRLTTADIDKKQEGRIHNEILSLQRVLHKSKPQIEIISETHRLQDHIKLLEPQLKAIKAELHQKITQIQRLSAEIDGLNAQKDVEVKQVEKVRSIEQIKADYSSKIKKVEEKREEVNKRIDAHYDKLTHDQDAYEDQQDLLRHIKYVEDQKVYLLKQKEEEEKRKKEKEEYEKKKQRDFQEREKKREEYKKYEEDRKKKEEDRKLKLEKEREAFINRNPNHEEIQFCSFLISYCQQLKPVILKQEEAKKGGEITITKEWQKQIKKGAQIIESKKNKLDQQIPKKQAKPKKKQQKADDDSLTHNFDIINRFTYLKILPPQNINQIDNVIKQIQGKIEIYNKPTPEEIENFKTKASKQFDIINDVSHHKTNYKEKGHHNHENQEHHEHNKNHSRSKSHGHNRPKARSKSEKHKAKKKELSEKDFPELNN